MVTPFKGVFAQQREGCGHRHIKAFVDKSLGLFDDDAAGYRTLQAWPHRHRRGSMFLQYRYTRDMGQCLTE